MLICTVDIEIFVFLRAIFIPFSWKKNLVLSPLFCRGSTALNEESKKKKDFQLNCDIPTATILASQEFYQKSILQPRFEHRGTIQVEVTTSKKILCTSAKLVPPTSSGTNQLLVREICTVFDQKKELWNFGQWISPFFSSFSAIIPEIPKHTYLGKDRYQHDEAELQAPYLRQSVSTETTKRTKQDS